MPNIRPRKALGQHFLVDNTILNKIISYAELKQNDVVVEIGAGRGDLTALLAARSRVVIALELDRRFIDGERILGANKTIRGFISGLILGSLVGTVESLVMSQGMVQRAFLISLGSLSGDLFGAFTKRRLMIIGDRNFVIFLLLLLIITPDPLAPGNVGIL
jgi:hypothetical protein